MEQNNIDNILKEYEEKYSTYTDFSLKLKNILVDILNSENFEYLSVESRTKEPLSLRQKLESDVIRVSSLDEIRDLVGVRIIAYVYEDISNIRELIENNFETKSISIDERLGIDKVGYRSYHCLISLPNTRLTLPEYKKFKNLKAELQIRTILEHAWAQIGHNQIYKPNVILPDKIKRDFTLLSGLLEIADNEFSRISGEILNYSNQIDERTSSGDLEIQIDSVSLRKYFNQRFGNKSWIEQEFGPRDDMAEKIIEEFSLVDIGTLKELDIIIPKDFDDVEKKIEKLTNYCGIARNIMIIAKPELYFKKAWRESWGIGPNPEEDLAIYKHYNIDIENLMEKYFLSKKNARVVQK
jgi:ppGpp synthetase/RelA/SpoT-type nucleotidyltranferase